MSPKKLYIRLMIFFYILLVLKLRRFFWFKIFSNYFLILNKVKGCKVRDFLRVYF